MATPYPLQIDQPIVLASGSPRRRQLLALLNLDFEVVVPDVDETRHPGESPVDLVTRLAVAKAVAVSTARPDTIVVGADTAVEVDGEILGKPIDTSDAARMLRLLGGRSHRVHSGVAVADRWFVATRLRTSEVTFKALTDAEVDWYVATGEPLDKAGAYAVQGAGGAFVTSLNGSVSNVIGLPLDVLTEMLSRPTER